MSYITILRIKRILASATLFILAWQFMHLFRNFGAAFGAGPHTCDIFCKKTGMYILGAVVLAYLIFILLAERKKREISTKTSSETGLQTEQDRMQVEKFKKQNSFSKIIFWVMFICFFLIAQGIMYSIGDGFSLGTTVVALVVSFMGAVIFYAFTRASTL